MTAPLLQTRLYAPPVRPGLVSRPRLIERLNSALHRQGSGFTRKLTLVSAPAGFGKTTLLSEWVAECGRPVAWLSPDESDNDLVLFLTYAVAALQQIDPAIDEASNSLGADAQYTFRKITLPLISPALLAGLIFSFTRHMTSLSAIIFLVSPQWRIVTASILSEWEQGGVSFAAAYATVIIVLVLIAIGLLYFITNKVLGGRGEIDLSLGA